MRDSPRLLTPHPLGAGLTVPLSAPQAHRLLTVLRQGDGGALRLFNGRDGEWAARLVARGRGAAEALVGERLRAQVGEPGPVLVFAALKRDATDLVAQKATELGASALQPVLTERTVAGRVNTERLRLIAAEASEQCERLTVPEVREPRGLMELLGDWPMGCALAAAIERREAPLVASLPGGAGALLVGPEGGFTPGELDALLRRPFVLPVSLGPRILRAETAAIAGLALLGAAPSRC